jgi:hypothetical protein
MTNKVCCRQTWYMSLPGSVAAASLLATSSAAVEQLLCCSAAAVLQTTFNSSVPALIALRTAYNYTSQLLAGNCLKQYLYRQHTTGSAS